MTDEQVIRSFDLLSRRRELQRFLAGNDIVQVCTHTGRLWLPDAGYDTSAIVTASRNVARTVLSNIEGELRGYGVTLSEDGTSNVPAHGSR